MITIHEPYCTYTIDMPDKPDFDGTFLAYMQNKNLKESFRDVADIVQHIQAKDRLSHDTVVDAYNYLASKFDNCDGFLNLLVKNIHQKCEVVMDDRMVINQSIRNLGEMFYHHLIRHSDIQVIVSYQKRLHDMLDIDIKDTLSERLVEEIGYGVIESWCQCIGDSMTLTIVNRLTADNHARLMQEDSLGVMALYSRIDERQYDEIDLIM